MKGENSMQTREIKTNNKIILKLLLIILAIVMIGVPVTIMAKDDLADPVAELTEEELAAKIRDDNPEVTKYLVSDESISRVLPHTSLNDFILNFGEERIKVYKDKTCQEE